jgi:subtilisin-like proprotein convertase family protein
MRWRAIIWFVISLLCLVGARCLWQWADERAAAQRAQKQTTSTAPAAPVPALQNQSVIGKTISRSTSPQFLLLSEAAAKAASAAKPLAYRLNNTGRTAGQLLRDERAIILENALIDTERRLDFSIPAHLRAAGDPGTYIVQSRGPVDDAFRAALRGAGASVVSYIPNHAYLIRVPAAGAEALRANPETQAVLAWEPYYKLKASLLALAVTEQPLPEGARLNAVIFPDAQAETRAALAQLGAEVLAEVPSPFGPVWTVQPAAVGWTELARLPGVLVLEQFRERVSANDLSRVRVGVATNTVATNNYLNLTGQGVMVNVNDTGVSAGHPDLAGRVFGDTPASLVDSSGHGTHVAGIIAGDGNQSTTVTNARGSINPGTNAQFRGKAPAARIFSMATGLGGPLPTDDDLQERAVLTNALISNNSWNYSGDNTYGIGAASYDAAARDALPGVPGSQPLLFVFGAGNGAGGDDSGLSGDPETILSPGTAKNVITVGAIEQLRDITNEVWKCAPCSTCTNGVSCATNTPWRGMTSSDNQVAAFSGRGNVGIGIEGDFGRFKPDMVAPGTFVLSTRSLEWDERAYYNPTNHHVNTFRDQLVLTNQLNNYSLFVPQNAVQVIISVVTNVDSPSPFPTVPIYVRKDDIPTTSTFDFVRNDSVSMPPDHGSPSLGPADVGTTWFYSVENTTTQNLSLDIITDIVTTNDLGNYYEVLSNLNNSLTGGTPPHRYRYESGTSMSAADASGTLALMQEFFERRLGVTNSPAMYKALLINGARSVSTLYDFQVENTVNFQGWGLIQLPNSVPEALTNGVTQPGPAPMRMYDQNPTTALATGQSQTRQVRLSPDALGLGLPLRVTLVWTDPPGNPAAAVKLVNDLDLVVTNLDTGEIFFGNDIGPSSNFTFPWDTNAPPNSDAINNVENVYLLPPLGTNYAVTVIGRHVNVNAVTAHPNNVAQDYALVISYGNGQVADAVEVTPQAVVGASQWTVTRTTNDFRSSAIEGQLLLGQHVGANTPLLGVTNGITNQWTFYMVSNRMGFSNAAFVTFLPSTLSLPRLGAREDDLNNATRREADIDLYVSDNPGLTNLVPSVIASAQQSRGRTGTELVVYSNSVAGQVYYVGVKSEDQMAAEYAFLAVFSRDPFSLRDGNGNLIVPGIPIPAIVPDGSPADPGVALVLGLAIESVPLRRVVVATNAYIHETPGDLIGTLSHGDRFAVLNNHRGGPANVVQSFIYEDNNEGDIPFASRTDGPGSLRDFVGQDGLGVWLLAMTDDSLSATGEVRALVLQLEPQNLDSNATVRTVAPNSFTFDFIDVPVSATNLTVCVASNTAPMELYIRRGDFPSRTLYDYTMTVPIGGGCLSVDKSDLPPLTSGRYFIGVFNSSGTAQTILLTATLGLDPSLVRPIAFDSGDQPLLDDAVNYSGIFVNDRARIAQVEVGVRVDHPRISDLAFHLISPRGTRVLLMENRGNTNSASAGTSVLTTNVTIEETDFETALPGPYSPGLFVENWTVTSNVVTVIQDATLANTGTKMLSLNDGGIGRNFATTPGADCVLTYAYRRIPTLDGLVSWWPAENNANDIVGTNHGVAMNGASFAPGRVGQAFLFDGQDDHVRVTNSPSLQRSGPFTVEFWFKPVQTITPFVTNSPMLFSKGTDDSINIANAQPGDPRGQIEVRGPTPRPTGTTSTWSSNAWHHVAVTYDSTTYRLFVNGMEETNSPSSHSILNTTDDVRFGGSPVLAASFNGLIDEPAVFDRAISAIEVQAIYAAGAAGKCGLTAPPTNCLSFTAQVIADGITNTFTALSTNWGTNTINFVATQTNTYAAFSALGTNSGLFLDTISLRQTVIVTQNFYLTFTEDTNRAGGPIKFAVPPFATPSTPITSLLSGFEPAAVGDYVAPAMVDGWDVLTTNRVTVPGDPLLAHTGTNSLALLAGEIRRTLPTTFGRDYRLDFVYHGVTNVNPISWWPADFSTNDVADGNHGILVSNAVFGAGRVGQSFVFDGNGDGVEIGTATNLQLQDFSIEAWIKRSSTAFASFNGNSNGTLFALGTGGGGYGFWIQQTDNRLTLGKSQVNQVNPIAGGQITDTNWHHVAVTKSGTTVFFYVDGVEYPAPAYISGGFTFTAPGYVGAWNPGGQVDNSFYGAIDELAVYDRILTATEIRDIYGAGAEGKCGMITPPSLCPLTGARVFVSGLVTNSLIGTTNWLTNSMTFTSAGNGTPVGLAPVTGGQSGLLLDTFTLTEYPGSIYYLPEESLSALVNENAFGLWRLEILDTRTGATNLTRLVSWQLQFVYQTDIPLPAVLTHGEPLTNSIPPGQTAYYIVDVPAWAQFATNTLLFANPPPGVNVLFNQNQPPSPQLTNAGDFILIGPNATSGSRTLDTTGVPPPALLPGQRYYLGVFNPGAAPVTYAIRVDFDITPLFNGVPVTSTLNVGALPRYFYYDVSTNATAVLYQLTNLSGNVELVARQGTPLPTLADFDYGSLDPGIENEGIFVFTNSSPVALSPGRWYLGVFNVDVAPVTYTIVANEYTNLAPFITLTNGIPYPALNTGAGNATDYYRYVVTGSVARAQFEINNPNADMTLVARKGLPLPDLGLFDYLSANPHPNDELIVLFTNSTPVALTTGDWFLSAINVSGGPASYSIKATQWSETGRPFVITDSGIVGNSFCLTWNSLLGVHYYVQGLTNLSSTINYWETISPTITATGPVTTYCVPLPTLYQFFRVVEGLALSAVVPPPTIGSIIHTNNTVELRWSGPTYASYRVQWTPTLIPPTWNTFTNVVTSATGQFIFVDDGTQTGGLNSPRYYRLRTP